MKTVLFLFAAALPAVGLGQMVFEPLSVHPGNVSRDGEFLLALEDRWINGCGGQVSASVGAERIELLATSASEQGVVCPQVFEPFADLIRPRAAFDGVFADEVAVSYDFIGPDGERAQRSSLVIRFSDEPNPTVLVETGSWITDALQSSGLFVDQQDGLFSANLADYANGTGAWFFGAAPVNGDTVIAEISRYGTIQCVTAPCDRAAPVASGTLLAVLRDSNDMLVKYQGILENTDLQDQAMVYQRLDLDRAGSLQGAPDLEGQWIIGVGPGNDGGLASTFGVYDLSAGDTRPVGGLETITFAARDVNRLDDSLQADFFIQCQDARPVDGELNCATRDFNLVDEDCVGLFPFAAAGLRRVRGIVSCAGVNGDFVMVRR